MRITGRDAITYAEHHGVTLHSYTDPVGGGGPVTLERALDIVESDPTLIYCNCPPGTVAWGPTRANVLWVHDAGGRGIWSVLATPTVFATSAREATERARAELLSLGFKDFIVRAESDCATDVGCAS